MSLIIIHDTGRKNQQTTPTSAQPSARQASPSGKGLSPRIRHSFGRIPVHAAFPAGQKSDRCPLQYHPTRCPFGGACHLCPPLIQAKSSVSRPGDAFEREADRIAESVVHQSSGAGTAQTISRVGQHPGGPLPSSVQKTLQSSGLPLSSQARSYWEPRFGHDFGSIRIHADADAAQSARSLNALAYTAGRNIVFGAGRYAPHTSAGQHLLAHELVHTLQQGAGGEPGLIQRLNYRGDDFTEAELQTYLEERDSTGAIEDDNDSDDKARAIANDWRLGGSPFVLTAQRKQMLIREMLSGPTGNDDEAAILELLERSYNFELSIMLGPSSVSPASLDSNLHGDEDDQLMDFFDRRFDGGQTAVLSGTIRPQGLPLPLSIDMSGAGQFFDANDVWDVGMELRGGTSEWNEEGVLSILCTQDRSVVAQLASLDVKRFTRLDVTRWRFDGTAWVSQIAHPSGMNDPDAGLVAIREDTDCDSAAEILFHEVRHQGQDRTVMPMRYDREVDAYTTTEQWTIDRGLPGHPSLRTAPGPVPDPAAIAQYVEQRYGGPQAVPGEVVVGHRDPATTVIRRPDRTTYDRPSQPGDVYIDDTTLQIIGEDPIPQAHWRCPL